MERALASGVAKPEQARKLPWHQTILPHHQPPRELKTWAGLKLTSYSITKYDSTVQQGPQRSRRGPWNNITQKPASIFPDDDEAVLVR